MRRHQRNKGGIRKITEGSENKGGIRESEKRKKRGAVQKTLGSSMDSFHTERAIGQRISRKHYVAALNRNPSREKMI